MQYDPSIAENDARRDWAQQTCKRLCVGLVGNVPYSINHDCGLITQSIGEWFPTPEEHIAAKDYCSIYNATVDALIAEHGIPEWADVHRRRADRERMLLLIAGRLHPKAELKSMIDLSRHSVDALVRWTWKAAVAFADLPEEGVSFLVGDISPRCGRVDMYDSKSRPGRLIASEHYQRRHFPHLPWDAIAAQCKTASEMP